MEAKFVVASKHLDLPEHVSKRLKLEYFALAVTINLVFDQVKYFVMVIFVKLRLVPLHSLIYAL
jgi:hypothetical protein